MHSLILLFISLSLPFLCLGKVHWCYDIQNTTCGPSHWKHDHPSCGLKKQSPINIVTKKAQRDVNLTPITFEGYDDPVTDDWTITNNGHSVQVTLEGNIAKGNIAIQGGNLPNRYKAVQFHYHWGTESDPGSEHTIDGEQYPMELHIVHMNEKYSSLADALKDPDGLAVLGFMFAASDEENSKTEHLINALKTVPHPGNVSSLNPFPLKEIILDQERRKKYYRYSGSLTTPGCSEAVIWTVFEEPILLRRKQLDAFSETLFYSDSKRMALNFRPVQKRNGRIVYVSDSAVRPFDAAVLTVLLAVWSSILFN